MSTPTTPKTINTTPNQTIKRELLLLALNIPVTSESTTTDSWHIIGKRTESSNMEYNHDSTTVRDIIGNTWTDMKAPVITQQFDPVKLDSADAAAKKIWELAIRDHDMQALSSLDMLVIHLYAEGFAERYSACAVDVTGLGGDGGDVLNMPFTVTFGGERTKGTATITSGVISFTADT